MSHFGILVIGGNVEHQLAPYHEFECTGENDQYVQDVDVTQEMNEAIAKGKSIEDALSYYGLEDKIVDDESKVEKSGEECQHKYGYAIVKDGKLIKAVTRTNPNKKWDWWVVGGCWSGWLKLKTGANGKLGRKGLMGSCADDGPGRADHALKGAIDFDGMREEAGQRAAEAWDKASEAHGGQTWEPWSSVGPRMSYGDEARVFYREQPPVQALRRLFKNPFHNIDVYLKPRDQFIREARDQSTVLYAVVKDGQWISKGDMGWWGMSDDKVDQADWNAQVNSMLDALPEDTPITVVDCHI